MVDDANKLKVWIEHVNDKHSKTYFSQVSWNTHAISTYEISAEDKKTVSQLELCSKTVMEEKKAKHLINLMHMQM